MNIVLKILSFFCCFWVFVNCEATDKRAIVFEDIIETDSRFIINEQDEIVFSGSESGRYNLQIYKNGKIENIKDTERDIFQPFIYKNKICGIYDHNGNELFHATNDELQKILEDKPLQKIQSSTMGKVLIIQFKNDNGIYILESENSKLTKIADIQHRFNNWVADDTEQKLYLSYDDKIVKYDIKNKQKEFLDIKIAGEKRNLFIDGNNLYFNNNSQAEFYEIYKYQLNGNKAEPTLVHKSNHDVMMPKVKDEYLYFIENINGEYILKRKLFDDDKTKNLTKNGVIYQYDFYKDNGIAMIYSDFNTPKSFVLYDLRNGKLKNLSGKSIDIKADCSYKTITAELSPAYIFKPDTSEVKGIILFFHPGLHSDFSPRWDTALMTLIENGFLIVAPNYPMSTGYGKKYQNRPFGEAVKDMLNWKNNLSKKYKNLSLFYMAASSGNILMEECLRMDSKNVKTAIALFGLYSRPRPLFDIPALYILGENDPKVNFKQRKSGLNISTVEILSFDDEGHWLRRKQNSDKAINIIVDFLNDE